MSAFMSEWKTFECRVPGKWVLTGEHAVLRGAPAVALPNLEVGLTLKFEPRLLSVPSLQIEPKEAQEVVQEILKSLSPLNPPSGLLRIESTIPIGAGLGSSAALCVALTRWLAPTARETEVATELEHRFHGRSSGMDVAVISAGVPVSFTRGKGATPLAVTELPRFTLHDTGLRARTSDCVRQVEELRVRNPQLGASIDEQMAQASRAATEGLRAFGHDSERGLVLIASAMTAAQQCFEAWGLVPPQARHLQQELLAQGALAAKLTGAGGGGMIAALWR